MTKVAIIGAGTVGSSAAFNIAMQGLADEIVMIDLRHNPMVIGELFSYGGVLR